MNSIFISLVSAMAFSVLLAISERNVVVSSEAIKITDWMQGVGSVISVIIALVAAIFAMKAAKSTEKIAINQSIVDIARYFSEHIGESFKNINTSVYGSYPIDRISDFITWSTRAREGIDTLSTHYQKKSHYNILKVYLEIGPRLEIRDCEKFYLSLEDEIERKGKHFFDAENYHLWLTIQQQYKDMRAAIFPSEPEGEYIEKIRISLSKDIMLQKLDKEERERQKADRQRFSVELREYTKKQR
jgi:hypothetical protein